MTIRYDPAAADVVRALLAAPSQSALAERVLAALRHLDDHPGDARSRRRSYGDLGWGMPVRSRDDEWLILWRPGADGVPYVRYIGPEP